MMIDYFKHWLINKFNLDVVHACPLNTLLVEHDIGTVVDVGANIGQTRDFFRHAGYKEDIISFEPHPETFKILLQKHRSDKLWHKWQIALSSKPTQMEYLFTGKSESSGFLKPKSYPIEKTIKVEASTLDIQFCKFTNAKNILLKVDAEGHDLAVIKGAEKTIRSGLVKLIMLEVAFAPRFVEEPTVLDSLIAMDKLGFRLCKVQCVHGEPDQGISTAADFIFCQK